MEKSQDLPKTVKNQWWEPKQLKNIFRQECQNPPIVQRYWLAQLEPTNSSAWYFRCSIPEENRSNRSSGNRVIKKSRLDTERSQNSLQVPRWKKKPNWQEKCYHRPNIILKDICQRKNPISVGLELGLTKLQIFVTEVVTNPQKPCDKSRRRFFKNPVTKVVAEPSRST